MILIYLRGFDRIPLCLNLLLAGLMFYPLALLLAIGYFDLDPAYALPKIRFANLQCFFLIYFLSKVHKLLVTFNCNGRDLWAL